MADRLEIRRDGHDKVVTLVDMDQDREIPLLRVSPDGNVSLHSPVPEPKPKKK